MRTAILTLFAVLLCLGVRARTEDETKPDAEAQKKLEERLKSIEEDPTKGLEKKGKRGGDGPAAGGAKGEFLARFDANGDGALDKDEFAKAKEALARLGAERKTEGAVNILDRFDLNKDGQLSKDEWAKAKEILAQGRGAGGGEEVRKRVLEKFDENKDGKLDEVERAKMQAALEDRPGMQNGELRKKAIEKYDENKDGKLDEAERAKAREGFMQKAGGGRGEKKADSAGKTENESPSGQLSDDERRKAIAEFDKLFEEK